MIRILFASLLVGTVSTLGFAQGAAETQTLNQRIAAFYQQGKFDEAIPLAERVVANEKQAAKNSEIHALALTNLAMLHKEKAKAIKKGLMNLEFRIRQGAYAEADRSASKAKDALRDVLEIYTSSRRSESIEAAAAKSELAWLTYNFIHSRSISETRSQIDEAERLYTESISMREKLGAGDEDMTLRTILEFGDFYMRYVNFEKALAQYETYVARVEKRYGEKSRGLVPALRALKEVYFVTTRDDEAKAVAERIASITGAAEKVQSSFPIITLRSKAIAAVKAQGFIPIDFTDRPTNLYPYAAGAGSISPLGRAEIKGLAVNITVDEEGNVIEAQVQTQSKYKAEVEAAAKASTFRPFSYRGKSEKMRGSIVFRYFDR